MLFKTLLSVVVALLFSTEPTYARDDAGSVQRITLKYTPAGDRNGYLADVPFSYVFRNCYSDLHVNIARGKATANQYQYKGKAYWPGFFGKQSFDKVSLELTTVYADVLDRGQKLGTIKLYNVTRGSAGGCFSDSVYSVSKGVGGDAKEMSKRPKDFSLTNFRMETGARDYKLEEIAVKNLKEEKAKQAAAEKPADAAGVAAAAGQPGTPGSPGAPGAQGSNAAPNNKAGQSANQQPGSQNQPGQTGQPTQPGKTAQTQQATNQPQMSEAEKRQKAAAEVEAIQKKHEQDMKEMNKAADETAKKVGDAAVNFYSGWQGSGTSIGINFRAASESDEQSEPFWMGFSFGRYWNPKDERAAKKWISAFDVEYAFNSEYLDDVTTRNAYGTSPPEWTRYNTGFWLNFAGNITSFGYFQPYIGIGWVEKVTFNSFDEKIKTENVFTTDLGIAVNLGGEVLIKLATNSEMKVIIFGIGFMSGRPSY